ncbi:MAG: hypothetical protein FIO03_00310 [Nitrosopumilales archaeon]|nr:hypothetical protein [Nitrosopumilales archaeon]
MSYSCGNSGCSVVHVRAFERGLIARKQHSEHMKPFGLKTEKESVNSVLNETSSSEGRRDDGMVFGLEESEY